MSIALLCPTRSRPEQCKRMIDSVAATAQSEVHICLGLTMEEHHSYGIPLGKYKNVIISHQTFPDNCPTVHKWNLMAENSKRNPDLYMLAADDIIFTTPHWDKAIIDHYNALENKIHVYALRDSRDSDSGTPHPIVSREYIKAMGYFLPPIFMHWYVDTWTVEIAKANNCFTHLKDYQLVHDKLWDKGIADTTHRKIRDDGWLNNDMYVNERCALFLEVEKQRLALRMNA